MSNFNCDYCGKAILDSENGYVTECTHYPNKEGPTTTTMQRDIDYVIGKWWGVCKTCGVTIHPLHPHVFCESDTDYAIETPKQENKVPPR
ncbi:MAG: hypothetical protein A2W23_06270 [Planctomycetes bacterium RBG_16_43_13]|nr:MAG: hypothetical protein A2W23_06270 [Planctomycetes bacterium RBG_16_43_13]